MNKKAMYKLSYGLFICTAVNAGKKNGCIICGYEYVGEELPDDFICPLCKHPKDDFEKIVR